MTLVRQLTASPELSLRYLRLVIRILASMAFALACLLAVPLALAEEIAADKLVAVMDMKLGADIPEALQDPFTDLLINEMVRAGRYKLIDRANRDAILAEQGFQCSDAAAEECRVEAGQLLGVGRLVTGKISALGGRYFISAQLLNVQSGAIEKSADLQCDCALGDVPLQAKIIARRLSGMEDGTVGMASAPKPAPAPATKPEEPPAPQPGVPVEAKATGGPWMKLTGISRDGKTPDPSKRCKIKVNSIYVDSRGYPVGGDGVKIPCTLTIHEVPPTGPMSTAGPHRFKVELPGESLGGLFDRVTGGKKFEFLAPLPHTVPLLCESAESLLTGGLGGQLQLCN